jgi:hypothetical protein
VPLRPLGLAEILDGSVRAVRRNPRVLLGASVIVAVVQVTLVAALQLSAFRDLDTVGLQVMSGLVVGGVATGLLAGALSGSIVADVLGGRPTPGTAWRQVRGRLGPLVALTVVVVLAQDALLALCLSGVLLWGLWAVAVPALMVERTGVFGALSRSVQLVKGSFWRVWGIRAVGVAVTSFLGLMVTIPFVVLAVFVTGVDSNAAGGPPADHLVAYVLITSLGSVIAASLTGPIRAGIDVLLYLDLRIRKEGLDIAIALSAAEAPATAGRTR